MAAEHPPCSIVLEGGVTSAVVYATLLAHLSKHYSFRQLGGTSSGAVAAAAAAAAEFGRRAADGQPNSAFEELSAFPDRLAETRHGRTALYRLFQPTPRGLASFGVAMAALSRSGRDTAWGSAARVALALVEHFSIAALVLALATAGLGAIAAAWLHASLGCSASIDRVLGCASLWALMVSPIALGGLLLLAAWALWITVRALRDNHWGLCSGMGAPDFGAPALTPKLHALLQSLAGRAGLAGLPEGPLLTFGDLWWGPRVDGAWQKTAERKIDLQIITTAVTLQRPVRLPGAPGDHPLREFFYDPQEWQTLFPSDVLAHLKACARPVTLQRDQAPELLALPDPEHWPVLMAVRFSLSFPLLLSALPMYVAVPRREVLRAGSEATQLPFEARKVYFSDGGITSNCPVHLFDAPLPRFPTFGVNLYRRPGDGDPRPVRSDTRDPELDMATTSDSAGWTTPLPFLWAMLSTCLGWRDSLQRRLPGFRERLVHVGLPSDAGGLHLAMTPSTIRMLADQGVEAARLLVRDFATPRTAGQSNAWERHRWTRARISLTALRDHLQAFASRLDAGAPSYEHLLRTAAPTHHPFDGEAARHQAVALAAGVRELMHTLDTIEPADAMDRNAPEPQPQLHLSPPW
ncbi:MAG: patatin-like phospholipase family protein [Rubrivivax sp.]|nr:patatin-like phospholipase family protein [Rubrivivax sp.]